MAPESSLFGLESVQASFEVAWSVETPTATFLVISARYRPHRPRRTAAAGNGSWVRSVSAGLPTAVPSTDRATGTQEPGAQRVYALW